jgi:hypothetical protein
MTRRGVGVEVLPIGNAMLHGPRPPGAVKRP